MSGGTGFVYQRVLVTDGRTLRPDEHLRLAERALKTIYGIDTQLDATAIARSVPQMNGSATALLMFEPENSSGITPRVEIERRLLTRAPFHSPVRPRGVTFNYSIPYAGEPTEFQLLAASFFDDLAGRHTGQTGSARAIRRDGDRLISAGDAALFGIRGRTVFTAPFEDGAMETVERQAVIAATENDRRLTLVEQAMELGELRSFDELFLVDAAGITSFADCDGAKFSALIAPRLLTHI